MIKDDLAKAIAAKFDLSLNFSGKIIQAVLDELINGLIELYHLNKGGHSPSCHEPEQAGAPPFIEMIRLAWPGGFGAYNFY